MERAAENRARTLLLLQLLAVIFTVTASPASANKKDKHYEELCTKTSQCITKHAVCDDRGGHQHTVCICTGDKPLHDITKDICVPKKKHGEACTDATDCSTDNAVCHNNGNGSICSCNVDDVYHDEVNICVETKQYGEWCTETSQCVTQGAVCDDRGGQLHIKCICPAKEPLHDISNDTCVPKKKYGEACMDNTDCSTENAVCHDNGNGTNCSCDVSHVYHGDYNKCVERVYYGEHCRRSDECMTVGSVCRYSLGLPDVCRCPEGKFHYLDDANDYCETDNIGEYCSRNADCTTLNSYCVLDLYAPDNECQCLPGYAYDKIHNICSKD